MSSKPKKASNIFESIRKTFGSDSYGIKQFRSDIAKLKKKGLVSKKVDARSQEATRYMRSQVRKFADVLSGKAQVIHIPTNERAYYKESGFKTKGRTVVVPTPNKEKVRRVKPTKEGYPQYTTTQKTPSGTRRGKNTVVPYTSLEGFIRKEVITAGPLQPGERYAFRYHGNISYGAFENPENMLLYLAKYRSIEDAFERGDIEAQDGVYRNLEVFKITRAEQSAEQKAQRAFYESERKARNRARHNEWSRRRRERMTDEEREEANFNRRRNAPSEANRKWQERQKLKATNPDAYMAMLAKNRAYKASKKKK